MIIPTLRLIVLLLRQERGLLGRTASLGEDGWKGGIMVLRGLYLGNVKWVGRREQRGRGFSRVGTERLGRRRRRKGVMNGGLRLC